MILSICRAPRPKQFLSLSTTAGKLSKAEKVAAKRAAALAMLDKAEAEEQKRRKGQPAEESEDEEEGESDEDEVSPRYVCLDYKVN